MFRQLGWFGIYMVIAIILFLLLPLPIDMILLFGAVVLITYFRMYMQRNSGKGRIRNSFGLSSSSTSENQHRQLKYLCMSCGKEHNEFECPSCGSKIKEIG
jgi:hypothetical protein